MHKTPSHVPEPNPAPASTADTDARPLDMKKFSVKMASPSTVDPVARADASTDADEAAMDDDHVVGEANADSNHHDDDDVHHAEFFDPAPSTVTVSADDFLPIFTYVMVRSC